MRSRSQAVLPGTTSTGIGTAASTSLGQSRVLVRGALPNNRTRLPLSTRPGQLTNFRAAPSGYDGAMPSVGAVPKTTDTFPNAAHYEALAVSCGYPLSSDPFMRRSQLLLAASRHLRGEPAFPAAMSNSYSRSRFGSDSYSRGQFVTPQAPPSTQPVCEPQPGASAPAPAAVNLLVAHPARTTLLAPAPVPAPIPSPASLSAAITATNARSTAIRTTSPPHTGLASAVATATLVAAAAMAPPAAQASRVVAASAAPATAAAVASAASAAASSWMAIEELLAEAAYSLSQQIQTSSSPLDQLMASTAASDAVVKAVVEKAAASSAVAALPAALSLSPPASLAAAAPVVAAIPGPLDISPSVFAPLAVAAPPSVVVPPPVDAILELPAPPLTGLAAMPGGDRLTEMMNDLLYSLSQDINLTAAGKSAAAAGDAVASAATAAAAGLVGAVAELPRAAAIVYRSASDSAAAAAAARASTVRPAMVLPPETEPTPAPAATAVEKAAKETAAAPSVAAAPLSEPVATAVQPPETVVANIPLSAVEAAPSTATTADNLTASADTVSMAAAADSLTAVPSTPLVTAAVAPAVADAATATAASVVQATTSAAAGSVLILPPVPVPGPSTLARIPPPAIAATTAPSAMPAGASGVLPPSGPMPAPVPPPAPVTPAIPVPAPAQANTAPSGAATPSPAAEVPSALALTPAPATSTAPSPATVTASATANPAPAPAPAVTGAAEDRGAEVKAATGVEVEAEAAPGVGGPSPSFPEPGPETESSAALPFEDISSSGLEAQYNADAAGDTQLTAALQDLLSLSDGLETTTTAAAANSAVAAAASGALAPTGAEAAATAAAASQLTEALRWELAAAVGPDVDAADPASLADAAGTAITSALSSLDPAALTAVGSLPAEERLRTLLEAAMQSSLDLVDAAMGGIDSADSTVVGSVTLAAVMALLLRSLVSMASSAVTRGRDVVVSSTAATTTEASGARPRPVAVTAFEAAAALNNDVNCLLVDIRNASDVQEQGIADLRPFRRGTGAASAALPYCDFRATPTLANPSRILASSPQQTSSAARPQAGGGLLGLLGLGGSGAGADAANGPVLGAATAGMATSTSAPVTVFVDPEFGLKFKQLSLLNRGSKVFLLDSYGVESPEAVSLLRSDPELERMLGAQGLTFVEGGFVGPEGWKLSGLPVADPPLDGAGAESVARGLDFSRLAGGVSGLRMRYPSLLTRILGVGALGTGGVALASNLDWGAVTRGSVGIAAALLVADRALPTGVRPSVKLRQHLQAQLSNGAGANGGDAGQRRRTALLLRALDLVEAVGDAVVRAGSTAAAAAGSAAKAAVSTASDKVDPVTAAASPVAEQAQYEFETPPPQTGNATSIVLPHGMNSEQWGDSTTAAAAEHQRRSPSPTASGSESPTWRGAFTTSASAPDVAAARQQLSRSSSPLATRLGAAFRTAADVVTRAASPARDAVMAATNAVRSASPRGQGATSPTSRSSSPRSASAQPDTLDLMAALVAASTMNGTTLVPGMTAINFPKASAGQPSLEDDEQMTRPQPALAEDEAPPLSQVVELQQPTIQMWEDATVTEQTATEQLTGVQLGEQMTTVQMEMQEVTEEQITTEHVGQEEQEWSSLAGAMAMAEAELAAELADARLVDDTFVAAAPDEMGPVLEEKQEAMVALVVRNNWRDAANEAAEGTSTVEPKRWQWRLEAENSNGGSEGIGSGSSWRSGLDDGSGGGQVLARSAGRSDSPIRGRERAIAEAEALAAGVALNRPRRQPLRTASPERAAVAGAALRRMRTGWTDRDDDGLATGVYGSSKAAVDTQPDEGYEEVERLAAPEKRSGSAGIAAARMAVGMGGLSPGSRRQRVQVTAQQGRAGSRRQLLRTASPERAAAAAAAMRLLREEMGMSPNHDSDPASVAQATSSSATAVPVAPRDWRRELQGATGNFGGSHKRAAPVVPTSRSPRNWREQVEGSGTDGVNGNSFRGPRSSSARLSAAERAERDTRLADWRAVV